MNRWFLLVFLPPVAVECRDQLDTWERGVGCCNSPAVVDTLRQNCGKTCGHVSDHGCAPSCRQSRRVSGDCPAFTPFCGLHEQKEPLLQLSAQNLTGSMTINPLSGRAPGVNIEDRQRSPHGGKDDFEQTDLNEVSELFRDCADKASR